MKIYEIGTGYTSIPAKMGAATEIVAEELTRSLLRCGHEVVVIDIKDRNRQKSDLPIVEAYMPQFFSRTDTKLGVVHKLKRVLYSLSLTYKLHQLLRSEKQQVVLHFHNQYNLFFYLKFTPQHIRRKTTVIYTVHSYIWQGKWQEIKDVVQTRYFQEIECCRKADRVFVLNELTKQHFVEHLGIEENRIRLIANGVNTEVYYPMGKEQRMAVKRKLRLDGKIVFFQAGSVCERKNQMASVNLLFPLMKENPDVVFVYAGGVIDPQYKASFDQIVSSLGLSDQVLYVGELSPGIPLNEYFNIALASVFPSKTEAFGLVIIESMSSGIPVLVDFNSGQERPNQGNSGCLAYQSPTDFVEKCKMLMRDDQLLGQSLAARKCIVENYSWNKVADEYVKYFQ